MSILKQLQSILNPVQSYTSGNVVSIEGDRAVVSTVNGRVNVSIGIISSLAVGNKVHIADGVITGKLQDDNMLTRYYV